MATRPGDAIDRLLRTRVVRPLGLRIAEFLGPFEMLRLAGEMHQYDVVLAVVNQRGEVRFTETAVAGPGTRYLKSTHIGIVGHSVLGAPSRAWKHSEGDDATVRWETGWDVPDWHRVGKAGRPDRPGLPSLVDVTDGGRSVVHFWQANDSMHRVGGPAFVERSPGHYTEHWRQNDLFHREDGPAYVSITEKGTRLEWHHRSGPRRPSDPLAPATIHINNNELLLEWERPTDLAGFKGVCSMAIGRVQTAPCISVELGHESANDPAASRSRTGAAEVRSGSVHTHIKHIDHPRVRRGYWADRRRREWNRRYRAAYRVLEEHSPEPLDCLLADPLKLFAYKPC